MRLLHPSILSAGLCLTLGCGAALAAPPSALGRVLDPLERPSMLSERARGSLLTSVTRAGSRLVAVGDRGTVLLSDDEGKTWKQVAIPVSVLLTGVRFADAQRGWIVGHAGVILSTVDGGMTWTRVMDGNRLAALVLEGAKARATSAQGGSAQEINLRAKELEAAERFAKEGADKPFFDLMIDPELGFLAVGAFGMLLHSNNGIDGWEVWQDRIPNTSGSHLYAIVKSGGSLYLAGEQGSVFRSQDKGQTFKEIASPYKGSFFSGLASGKEDLLVFGLRGSAYLLKGDTQAWQQIPLPTQATVNQAIRLRDGSVLLVTQGGEALHSVDGLTDFKAKKLSRTMPIVGAVQAGGSDVVLAGVQGLLVEPIGAVNP